MNVDKLRQGILQMDVPNEALRVSMLAELKQIQNGQKTQKVGRNDPCPCGSGKKYKKCCCIDA